MARKPDSGSHRSRRKPAKLSRELRRALREEADREQRMWDSRPYTQLSETQKTEIDAMGDEAVTDTPEVSKKARVLEKKSVSQKASSVHNPAYGREYAKGLASSPNRKPSINVELARHASVLLALAAGVGFLMAAVVFTLEGGMDAIKAIGGLLHSGAVPITTAKIALALDTLFPIFYGAGFALLASSLQSRGNRPLVRLVLTAILFSVFADFAENALVFNGFSSSQTTLLLWPLTVVKFAGLAFSGVVLSSLIPRNGFFGMLSYVLMRFFFPISVSVLIAGIGGEVLRQFIAIGFPLALLILAIFASEIASWEKIEPR